MFFPVVFLVCIIFLFNYLFQENNQVGAEMGESSDEELARAILPGLGGNALGSGSVIIIKNYLLL